MSTIKRMTNKYEQIKTLIDEASVITILSGAGVSVPSGIPDFRSRDGLYSNEKDVMDILSRQHFQDNPEQFWADYRRIFHDKLIGPDFQPNSSHEFIGFLKSLGKDVQVITQNVDDLYQKVDGVDAMDIVQMHGNAQKCICTVCREPYRTTDVIHQAVPRCSRFLPDGYTCNGLLDVDVVLFGDMVRNFQYAMERVSKSDLLFVMGTSLSVSPFNTLLTNNRKRKNVLLNMTDIANRPFEVKLLMDVAASTTNIMNLYGHMDS